LFVVLAACAPAPAPAARHVELALSPLDVADAAPPAPLPTTPPTVTASAPPPPERHASVYPVIRYDAKATTVPEAAATIVTLVVNAMRADATATLVVRGSAEKGEPGGTALARAKATALEITQAGIAASRVRTSAASAPGARSVEFLDASGERFSVLYTEWEACCRNTRPGYAWPYTDLSKIPPDPVVFFVDDERPDTPAGRAAQAEAKQRCAQCNGDWGIHGLAPIPGCLCRTPDAHKPCTLPRDCRASCEIPWADAIQSHGSAQIPAGRCAEFYGAFGCRGWIIETDGGARDTQWICRD
jgi:hypothetical protein